MKKLLLASIFLLSVVACGNEPPAKSAGISTGTRCAFGDKSYPTGERVCQSDHEMECREDASHKDGLAAWVDSGKACKSGEPAAVPAPPPVPPG